MSLSFGKLQMWTDPLDAVVSDYDFPHGLIGMWRSDNTVYFCVGRRLFAVGWFWMS